MTQNSEHSRQGGCSGQIITQHLDTLCHNPMAFGSRLLSVVSRVFHAIEAVKNNLLGTENAIEDTINCSVQRVVRLSIDKAVCRINTMDIRKRLLR